MTETVHPEYSLSSAADYWGVERLADVPLGDARAEDLAVLCKGKPEAIAAGYARWETGVLDQLLDSARLDVVLDVGCGVGRILQHLVGRTGRLVGVDVSPGMVQRARARLAGAAEVLVAPAGRLPLADGTVHTVVCLGVLEHLPRDERHSAVAEMARVLVPGGHLVLECNNASAFLVDNDTDNPYRRGVQLVNGYFCEVIDTDELFDVLAAQGFRREHWRANPFYSVVRHLLPDVDAMNLGRTVDMAVDLDLRTGGVLREADARVVCDQSIVRLVKESG